jgi:hypothetical protein
LNLQHDCHSERCQVTNTRSAQIERLNTTIKTPEVTHHGDNKFILNSASLHAPEAHRRLADLPINSITPEQWLLVCQAGLENWGVITVPDHAGLLGQETQARSPDICATPNM